MKSVVSMVRRRPILSVVLVLLVAAVVGLFVQNQNTASRLSKLDEKLTLQTFLLKNNAYGVNTSNKVVADKDGKFVYLPEMRIKLPVSQTAKTVIYTMRDDSEIGGNASSEADVSSTLYQYPDTELEKDCGSLVRLKLEKTPAPYNQHEKSFTVKLADGRTLQVYQFVNEPACQSSWTNSMDPAVIADLFKQAQSY